MSSTMISNGVPWLGTNSVLVRMLEETDQHEEQIDRHVETLQSGDADDKEKAMRALSGLASRCLPNYKSNRAAIAQRLLELLSRASRRPYGVWPEVDGRSSGCQGTVLR